MLYERRVPSSHPMRRRSLAKPGSQGAAIQPSPSPAGVGQAAVVGWGPSMRGISGSGAGSRMVSAIRAGSVLLLSCMAVSMCETPCFDGPPCFPRSPPSGNAGKPGLAGAGWSLWRNAPGHDSDGSRLHAPADLPPLRLRGGGGPRGRGRGGGGRGGEDRWEAKAEREASSSSKAVSSPPTLTAQIANSRPGDFTRIPSKSDGNGSKESEIENHRFDQTLRVGGSLFGLASSVSPGALCLSASPPLFLAASPPLCLSSSPPHFLTSCHVHRVTA